MKKKYRNHMEPWTKELKDLLTNMFVNGMSIPKLAKYFGRTEGAIHSQLCDLRLIDYTSGRVMVGDAVRKESFLKQKESRLRTEIKNIRAKVKSDVDSLNQKTADLVRVQEELDKANITRTTLEKMLDIAIKDMLSNSWYSNEEAAFESLLERAING